MKWSLLPALSSLSLSLSLVQHPSSEKGINENATLYDSRSSTMELINNYLTVLII